MTIADEVKDKCESALQATHVECVDVSDGGCAGAKLELLVVSPLFEGVPLLKRHRQVNEVLTAENLMDQIHAVTIKAWTPQQYQDKQ